MAFAGASSSNSSMSEAIRKLMKDEEHLLDRNPGLQSFFSKLEGIVGPRDVGDTDSCDDGTSLEEEELSNFFPEDDDDSDVGLAPKRFRLRSSLSSLASSEGEASLLSAPTSPFVGEALANDCILTKVFQCLRGPDTKSCRLVNRKFCEIATFVLVQKKACEIIIDYSKEEAPIKLFSELCDCISRSKKFPATCLRLQGSQSFIWDFERNPKLVEFFTTYANLLTSVQLNFGVMKQQHWRSLFTELLPNIENLELGFVFLPMEPRASTSTDAAAASSSSSSSSSNSNSKKESQNNEFFGVLKCLKSLRLLEDFHLTHLESKKEEISRYLFKQLSTPNLRSIRNIGCEFLPDILQVGKVFAVKELRFMPKTVQDIDLLSKFADHNPQLESINIISEYIVNSPTMKANVWPLAKVLSRILDSSKETLKSLTLRPFSLLQDMQIPVMSAVETVKMTDFPRNDFVPDNDFGTLRIFPNGLKVSVTFPNLKSLQYEFPEVNKNFLEKYFPVDVYVIGELAEDSYFEDQTVAVNGTVEQYASVEQVNIVGNHPKALLITTLQYKFPNLTTLKIDFGMKCLNKSVPPSVLWNCRSPLLSLELYNVRYCDYFRNFQQNPLDSFFTGIPDWLCAKLQMCNEKNVTYPDVRLIRKGYSICNLKTLKLLKICFIHDLPPSSARIFNLETDESPLISIVSRVYAFALMPDLRVVVAHDHSHPNSRYLRELLHPMNMYATFEHRKQYTYTFA